MMENAVDRSIFSCRCGHTWASPSVTRSKCPSCGAYVRSRVDIPTDFIDPRRTLSDVQDALSAIALRAKNQQANEIDVAMAKTFADSMKYLVPALEASMVQHTNDQSIVNQFLEMESNDADNPPALPAGAQAALPGSSQPASARKA